MARVPTSKRIFLKCFINIDSTFVDNNNINNKQQQTTATLLNAGRRLFVCLHQQHLCDLSDFQNYIELKSCLMETLNWPPSEFQNYGRCWQVGPFQSCFILGILAFKIVTVHLQTSKIGIFSWLCSRPCFRAALLYFQRKSGHWLICRRNPIRANLQKTLMGCVFGLCWAKSIFLVKQTNDDVLDKQMAILWCA